MLHLYRNQLIGKVFMKTTTMRLPINIVEEVRSFAAERKWSSVTALTEIVTSSPIFLEYLTEKNREVA